MKKQIFKILKEAVAKNSLIECATNKDIMKVIRASIGEPLAPDEDLLSIIQAWREDHLISVPSVKGGNKTNLK